MSLDGAGATAGEAARAAIEWLTRESDPTTRADMGKRGGPAVRELRALVA